MAMSAQKDDIQNGRQMFELPTTNYGDFGDPRENKNVSNEKYHAGLICMHGRLVRCRRQVHRAVDGDARVKQFLHDHRHYMT